MRRKRYRLLSIVLVLCMVLALLPGTAWAVEASGTCGDNLTWVLSDDGTLTISGNGDMSSFSWRYDSRGDLSTDMPWYDVRDRIRTVIIEEGVSCIGQNAFRGCSNLSRVVISNTVKEIKYESFLNCISLNSIIIPESVQKIDYQVFEGCNSLLSAGPIGSGANIEFGWTKEIPAEAFSCSNVHTVTFPEGIITIGERAFYSTGLTEIIIPDSVTFIGSDAFGSCDELEHIVIPANASCEGCIFAVCPKLNSAGPIGGDYNIEFGWTQEIPDYAFSGMGMRSEAYLESVVLPSTITRIGISAFEDCTDLKKIEIPNGVTKIGDSAFRNCRSLQAVKIPSSVKTIDAFAFSDCDRLENVWLSDGVENLEDMSFGFANFTSIFLPKSIKRIAGAFVLSDLTDVYYAGSEEDWEKIEIIYRLNDTLEDATIHYNSTGIYDDGSDNMNPVYFLSSWDSSKRQVKFGDPELSSPNIYTVADEVDVSGIDQLLNKYVLVTMEQGDSVLEYTITDIQPVESAIGTVTSTGEHSMTIDGTTFPVREDYVLASYDGQEVLYHVFNGTIMDFTVLKEKHGVLGNWNDTAKRLTIGETEYHTNYLSDLSFMDNIRDYFQKDVNFLVADSYGYCPMIKIIGLYSDSGNVNGFNADVYHANWLSQDTISATKLNEKTPSDILSEQLTNRGMEAATVLWKSLQTVFDTIDDPTSIKDFAFEKKDMYSAIILDTLEYTVSYDLIDSFFEDYYDQLGSLFERVSKAIQFEHNVDITEPGEFVRMTRQQREAVQDETKKWFEETYPELTVVNSVFDGISMGFDSITSLEDYGERITSTLLLAYTNEYMKAVIRQAYQNSRNTNNVDLQLALNECVQIMDASKDELCQILVTEEATVLGWKSLKYLIKEMFWGEVTKTLKKVAPEVAILKDVYKAEKLLCDKLTNANSAIEQYLKMLSILDVENLMNGVYNDLRQDFLDNKESQQALVYLEAMRLMFKLRDYDCESAVKYVDVIYNEDVDIFDDSLLLIIKRLLGSKDTDDIQALKKSIQNIQGDYKTILTHAEKNWIYELESDFPETGLYEKYSRIYESGGGATLVKEYKAACPVDVYVYDRTNNVVASIVDGRVSCSANDVMIALVDNQKVIRFYDGADYRVEYVGYDSGNMDVTITEFDEGESLLRTVNYYGIPLSDGKTYSVDASDEILRPYELMDKIDNSTVQHDYDSMDSNIAHSVKVISGTLQQSGELFVETTASKGETLQLDAYVPDGYEFVRWETSSETVLVADPSSVNTTMIMGDEDITVTAIVKTSTVEKTTVSITNVSPASDLVYTGTPQQGYTGTPTSAYTGEYDVLYTGRNNTEYNNATPPTDAGDYTVTIKVPDSDTTYAGSISLEFTIARATQTAPAAPEVSSKTSTSVSLKAVSANSNGAAAEYSKDGGTTWQSNPTFIGLSADTEYSFVVRYSETKNFAPSDVSAALNVQTSKSNSTTTSGGGPGSYTPPTYTITLPSVTGGKVSVSPASASSGDTVTITATPDSGYELTSLSVSDANGKSIDLTDKGNGQYSFKMPSGNVSLNAEFQLVVTDTPWANPFTDVSEGDWFYDDVAYVGQNGLMTGVGNGQFNPSGTTTRGMIMTILSRLDGVDTSGGNP